MPHATSATRIVASNTKPAAANVETCRADRINSGANNTPAKKPPPMETGHHDQTDPHRAPAQVLVHGRGIGGPGAGACAGSARL